MATVRFKHLTERARATVAAAPRERRSKVNTSENAGRAASMERMVRAVREGRRLERQRWATIMGSPHVGRALHLAVTLAADTNKPAQEVIAIVRERSVASIERSWDEAFAHARPVATSLIALGWERAFKSV